METFVIPLLLLVCAGKLTLGDGDDCRFYETLHSTHGESNSFIVENTLDLAEDIAHILYGSGLSTTHTGDAIYRIKLARGAPYRPIRVCVTSDIDRVIFAAFDSNGESHTERIRNPIYLESAQQLCMEQPGALETVTRVIVRFKNRVGRPYDVSDLLVEGCTGERVCGWSQYEDAGIEGGTIPQQSIVAGWVARPHEFPWQATLIVGLSFWCGATLIDSQYVLTAAHCVDGREASDFRILLGNEQLWEFSDNEEMYDVVEIIQHIYYVGRNLYNDIALLRIAPEVPAWTDAVRPVCMPQKPVRDLVGVNLTVSGWGATTAGGPVNNDLLYTTGLPAMSFHACESCQNNYYLGFASAPEDIVLDGMMCAGYCGENDRDACGGDSGGPLVRKNEEGAWELVGLVSWGFGCAEAVPGVYTDVYFYKYWIQENTPLATEPLFG